MPKRFLMLDYINKNIEVEKNVNEKRVLNLISKSEKIDKIIYLITREYRFYDNFAFNFALIEAKRLNVPLNIFALEQHFEVSNKEAFFAEKFLIMLNSFKQNNFDVTTIKDINSIFDKLENVYIISDYNPLIEINYPDNISKVSAVNARNIIPVWVSKKQEYSAFTFRRCVYDNISEFLTDFPTKNPIKNENLDIFLKFKIDNYNAFKNNPAYDCTSNLSRFINWGFISPQRVALEVLKAKTERVNIENYLEELIVRRELAENFVYFCKNYKSFNCAEKWAFESLRSHATDIRPFYYNLYEFENAKTHDKLWNACQRELVNDGGIFGYLRMYWAKMILNWTVNPFEAVKIAIYLNDKYSFDAPSPSGYVGILWSIAGLHDRAFRDNFVTGKIRQMTYSGIKRKFEIEKYIKKHGG